MKQASRNKAPQKSTSRVRRAAPDRRTHQPQDRRRRLGQRNRRGAGAVHPGAAAQCTGILSSKPLADTAVFRHVSRVSKTLSTAERIDVDAQPSDPRQVQTRGGAGSWSSTWKHSIATSASRTSGRRSACCCVRHGTTRSSSTRSAAPCPRRSWRSIRRICRTNHCCRRSCTSFTNWRHSSPAHHGCRPRGRRQIAIRVGVDAESDRTIVRLCSSANCCGADD